MAQMLNQTELKINLSYDPATGIFTWLKNIKTTGVSAGDIAGTCSQGYQVIKVNGTQYRAHRLAWLYVTGEMPEQQIDHINNHRSDNRFSNLRLASHSENMMNTSKFKNNTSGYKGVSWHKQAEKWQAKIQANGKRLSLGVFDTAIEAFNAYSKKSVELHGEFSNV
jgi:hypothetical protein